VVIVGGGLGAVRVVQQLRRQGFRGPITALAGEPRAPYDRPPLSKQVLRGERDATHFPDLDRHDVQWVLGTRAVALDAVARQVVTDDARTHAYDLLVLAPGGRPRLLPGIPAGGGVRALRTIDDALRLRDAVTAHRRVVIIGAGFIGCEVAASARAIGAATDVIEALPAPLIRVLGERVATKVAALHDRNGVRMHLDATVADIRPGRDADTAQVTLQDDDQLEPAPVVVGIGIDPEVEWLSGSGVELRDGIVCDSSGRTSVGDIFALGDAAQWWHPLVGEHRRVEHWTSTADQAEVVASTIIRGQTGEVPALDAAPYFWSDQFDVKIQGVGFIDPADDVEELVIGGRTLLLYAREGVVRGVVGFSMPAAVMRTKPLIERAAPLAEAIELLTG